MVLHVPAYVGAFTYMYIAHALTCTRACTYMRAPTRACTYVRAPTRACTYAMV